jgi:hypothetical protein
MKCKIFSLTKIGGININTNPIVKINLFYEIKI